MASPGENLPDKEQKEQSREAVPLTSCLQMSSTQKQEVCAACVFPRPYNRDSLSLSLSLSLYLSISLSQCLSLSHTHTQAYSGEVESRALIIT